MRLVHRLLLAALAAAAATSGCRRKKPEVRVTRLETPSAVLPRLERPVAPATDTREETRFVDAAGRKRKYVLVSPTSPEPGKSYPLVLVYHGDGGDAVGFHQAWPFERATGREAVLAYLDGVGSTWDLETLTDNKDVRFSLAVIDEIAKERAIDRTRIFATGYSSGGFFSNVLACHRPSLLRAIASNAGGAPYQQAEKWPNGYPKCPGQTPTAMLALHGERDFGVTLDSGRFSAEYWAYVNGCDTAQMETSGYAECHVYRGCPAGKAVGFCSVPTLGHWVWDRAAEASWTFFERQ